MFLENNMQSIVIADYAEELQKYFGVEVVEMTWCFNSDGVCPEIY
jgi:hypothetical protein